MRKEIVLLSFAALAGCGGGGVETAGSNATTGGSTSGSTHSFVKPTEAKTYVGVGGTQVYKFSTYAADTDTARDGFQFGAASSDQGKQVYAGSATTVRNSGISIAYDPRDATFTLTVSDSNSGASTSTRFQDPASRTDFGGTTVPQWGTPQLTDSNVRFLQAGDGNPLSPYSVSGSGTVYDWGNNSTTPYGSPGTTVQSTTFFYEVPGTQNKAGTSTKYVTYAGYVRNAYSWNTVAGGTDTYLESAHVLERGAFAYGELTAIGSVPTSGSGTYKGAMLATMVVNPTLDGAYGTELPTYFQWIEGSATVGVNFASKAVSLDVTGTVFDGQYDRFSAAKAVTVPAGATFTASGTATIDLASTGGFVGQVNSAGFSSTTNGAPSAIAIAGSSINGAFYGPGGSADKVEVGGGFRIVGGTPDQRVDVLGAFTGARTGN